MHNRMALLRKTIFLCLIVFQAVLSGCGGNRDQGAEMADTYRCAVGTSFRRDVFSREVSSKTAFCPGSAVRCDVYPATDEEVQYAEVSVIMADGKPQNYTWKAEAGKQIIGAGVIVGADEFATVCEEAGECYLERRDGKGEILQRSILEAFRDHFPFGSVRVTVDGSGYAHVDNCDSFGDTVWCIYAPDGSFFHEERYYAGIFRGLVTLPDGRVACKSMTSSPNPESKMECINTGNGEKEILFSYGKELFYDDGVLFNDNKKEELQDQKIYAMGGFDDSRIIFMDEDGIYLSDYAMEDVSRIFTWKQNGMVLSPPVQVNYGICADTAGSVFVLAKTRDGSMNYLELQPVPENVLEIELAAANWEPEYFQAVMEFNKTHPECRIVIRSDYDKTALLTRIMAGDGPVIIDSYAIPDWKQEKIWEPLENLVGEQTLRELNQAALKLGSINGTPYAAVSNYYIDTLVTCGDVKNWDYEELIERVRGKDDLKFLMRSSDIMTKTWLMITLFGGGEEDTYFVDANRPDQVIDKDKLTEAIRLTERYGLSSEEDRFEGIVEGRVLCGREILGTPIDLYKLRALYGENVKVAGYPHKAGGRHHLVGAGILAVRKNATEEEKKMASEFFETLLSYDVQLEAVSGWNTSFSVRNDVLEQQIEKTVEMEGQSGYFVFASGHEQRYVYEGIDVDELRRELYEMLENSVPSPDKNNDYRNILREEFEAYFSGSNSLDTLADHLNKRLGVYFNE